MGLDVTKPCAVRLAPLLWQKVNMAEPCTPKRAVPSASSPPPAPKKRKQPVGRRWMLTVFDEDFISSWTRINDYHKWLKNEDGASAGHLIHCPPPMTNDDKDWLLTLDEVCTYMIGQVELSPATKKEHVQLFIITEKPQRLTGIQKILGVKNVHAEIAEKPSAACAKYCSKEETRVLGPYEYGSLPDSQGKELFPTQSIHDAGAGLPIQTTTCHVLRVTNVEEAFVVTPISVWNDLCELAEDGLMANNSDAEEDNIGDSEGEEIVDLTEEM